MAIRTGHDGPRFPLLRRPHPDDAAAGFPYEGLGEFRATYTSTYTGYVPGSSNAWIGGRMQLDELKGIIKAAGGGENALAYAEFVLPSLTTQTTLEFGVKAFRSLLRTACMRSPSAGELNFLRWTCEI